MIVKMKFISITGPKNDIDRVTDQYLSKYEIQLENALSELKTTENLQPFVEINPYREALEKAKQLALYVKDQKPEDTPELSIEEIFHTVRDANHDYMELRAKENDWKVEREMLRERLLALAPFRPLNFNLHNVLQFRYIKFRFGRVPVDYYHRLEKYVYSDMDALFIEGGKDDSYVYGVYFVANKAADKTDSIFQSLHFERIYLPDEYQGNTEEAYQKLEREIEEITAKINGIDDEIKLTLAKKAGRLLEARNRLEMLCENFDVRKVAACVEDQHEDFYILCGWMAEKDVESLLKEVKNDPNIFIFVEEDNSGYFGAPPTKLENPKLFKPFEMFIKMYGLPAHNEMDPTIFVALTYTFIFGAMFGDVGQGLCLFLGGAILYKWKKLNLAGIVSVAGLFSTFFGWMFGSIFGFEDIIDAVWLRPSEAMTLVPGLGNMNTVFVAAIVFGMFLILITMIFHIINAVKVKNVEGIWFDQNSVCGLVFYGALTLCALLYLTGNALPATIVLALMFLVPLVIIMLKEPITRLAEKKTPAIEGSKPMFFVQSFFELFEIMLSFLSNTLSFVRIGAFAVSHAAMMGVVLMLAGAESGGNINWLIIVLGNAFVCAMEGLIVGIQVLRLEYYEMFSRFYKGSGKEFRPFLKHINSRRTSEQA